MARPVAIGEAEPAWHLHLRVPAVLDLGDGTLVELTALVDTGSEANLIRRDLWTVGTPNHVEPKWDFGR